MSPGSTPAAPSLTVVLADDALLLREGIAAILTGAGHRVVAQAGDAPSAMSAARALRPDLVIIDVRMPPENSDDGLRAAITLRAEFADMAVMVLSQYVAGAYLPDLLDAGAGGVGYLLKDRVGHVRTFLESVEQVAGGGTVIDPDVVRHLVAGSRAGPVGGLTAREREVLELMAEGRTNGSIAEALVVSEAAVRKHVGSIFDKLGLNNGHGFAGDRRVLAVLAYLRTVSDLG